ncbi:MAG: OmpH family outer membrane protein [Microgenomates group bacterium]
MVCLKSALVLAAMALMLWLPTNPPAQAQLAAKPGNSVVVIEQGRLFSETAVGNAISKRFEQDLAALAAENQKIQDALADEEGQLTEKRLTMEPTAFRDLADAFDKKVEDLRAAQEAKSRNLTTQIEQERKRFFEKIAPLLGDLMVELGAVVILDKSTIVISLGSVDITDQAIARIDSVLNDGTKLPLAAP